MADDSMFGGQLSGFGGGPEAAPGGDSSASAPVQPQPSFGSRLNAFFGGPNYTPAPPNASPLEQSENLLQQQVRRANEVATNPLLEFFYPNEVAKTRDRVPQLTQQLQENRQQQAQQAEIQKLGRNYGINNIPQGASRETATNLITDELQARYLDSGDPLAAQGLAQLGRADLVQAGEEQHLSAAAANNERYRTVIGKLASMKNPGQYAAAYQELVQQTKDGVHKDHELAFVPKTFEEFQRQKQQIDNALTTQQLAIDARRARMTQLGGVVPIQKQVDKDGNPIGLHPAIASQVPDDRNTPLEGVEPVTVGGIYNGNRLAGDKIGDIGDKWGMAGPKTIKTARDDIEPHKGTVDRAAAINKINDITSKATFGTNPFEYGHVLDQVVEISRNGVGGKGSATPGTIRIMEDIRGQLQTTSDKAYKEWGRLMEWYERGKKGAQPYVSPETLGALKDVVKTLKKGSDAEIGGVAGGVAHLLGRRGGKLEDLGFEPGVAEALKPYWAKGNQELKQDIASRPAVVMGGQRIVFDRAGIAPPGAKAPGGFDQPPDGAKSPSAPPTGGGGTSPTQAQVNQATYNIESNNGTAPDTPGSKYRGLAQLSPDEQKRYGVTDVNDRAQVERAMTLKAQHDGAVLTNQGLPNTPENRYLVHQQGSGGAPALLRNPDMTAWQAIQHFYVSDKDPTGEKTAKKAIWGNLPASAKAQFPGGVDSVKSSDFTGWWQDRYSREMAKVTGGKFASNYEHEGVGRAATAQRGRPGAPASFFDRLTGRTSGQIAQAGERGEDTSGMNPKNMRLATPEERASSPVVESAPDIGNAVGAAAGTLIGGPVGAVAGGAALRGAGQSFQDWMQGREQDPMKILQETGKGAILAAPALIPAAGMVGSVARVAASGGANAVTKAMEGGEAADITLAAAAGAAGGALGEGIGRLMGRTIAGNAARELGGAAEILADPHATAATRAEAMQVARHYNVTEQQLVAMRDAVQARGSRAQASLPGGAATEATASERIAPAVRQDYQAAQHGYGMRDDALNAANQAPGLRTNAVRNVQANGYDNDPTVMTAARRLDVASANATGRNPLAQFTALRNAVSGIKAAAAKATGLTKQALDGIGALGDQVKEMHVMSALGQPNGARIIGYSRQSDAMWRDLKTVVKDGDMLSAIGRGDERTSLGSALLNVVRVGTEGEDAALRAVTAIRNVTSNDPNALRAIQELYMREAFADAHAVPDIRAAAREVLTGKSSSVARALLSPEQLARVQHVQENAARFATKRKGEEGFESALMASEGAHLVGHAIPGAGLASAAFSLFQLRGNVRMFLRSLPANYRQLLNAGQFAGPARVGAAAGGAIAGQALQRPAAQ